MPRYKPPRKPYNERRIDAVLIRLTPSERILLDEIAAANEMTVSEFVRKSTFEYGSSCSCVGQSYRKSASETKDRSTQCIG
jgi:hypothetical protein